MIPSGFSNILPTNGELKSFTSVSDVISYKRSGCNRHVTLIHRKNLEKIVFFLLQ